MVVEVLELVLTVLPRPLLQLPKIPALVVRVEVSARSHRLFRVDYGEENGRVAVAHQRRAQEVDAVVGVDADSDVAGKHCRSHVSARPPGKMDYQSSMCEVAWDYVLSMGITTLSGWSKYQSRQVYWRM